MRKKSRYNPEAFDQFAQLFALSLFFMSLNLFTEAFMHLAGEETRNVLYTFSRITQFLQVLLFVVASWRLTKGVEHTKSSYKQGFLDSYVAEAGKRAAGIAWFVTIILFAVLDIITNTTELPADFFIKIPFFTLLGVFSISFFLIIRDGSDDEFDLPYEQRA